MTQRDQEKSGISPGIKAGRQPDPLIPNCERELSAGRHAAMGARLRDVGNLYSTQLDGALSMWSGVCVDSQPAIVGDPTVQDSWNAACFTLQPQLGCTADLDLRILLSATMDETFKAPQFRDMPDLLEPLKV
jgi:hypothetical protein